MFYFLNNTNNLARHLEQHEISLEHTVTTIGLYRFLGAFAFFVQGC